MSEIYESVYIIMEKFWNEVVIKLNNPDVRRFCRKRIAFEMQCYGSFIDFQDVFEKQMDLFQAYIEMFLLAFL